MMIILTLIVGIPGCVIVGYNLSDERTVEDEISNYTLTLSLGNIFNLNIT